jgi:alkyl hydroperoxide reductase subunit AhpC
MVMTLRLGEISPDFEQDTANGSLRLHAWLGRCWGLLFSYPTDFASVSATELTEVAWLKPDWDRRAVKPIGVSLDSADSLQVFVRDAARRGGGPFNFPLVADSDGTVATLYATVHPETDPDAAARCVFIIDPCKRVRLTLAYPPSVARSFQDLLRVIDGLQGVTTRRPCTRMPAAAGAGS